MTAVDAEKEPATEAEIMAIVDRMRRALMNVSAANKSYQEALTALHAAEKALEATRAEFTRSREELFTATVGQPPIGLLW